MEETDVALLKKSLRRSILKLIVKEIFEYKGLHLKSTFLILQILKALHTSSPRSAFHTHTHIHALGGTDLTAHQEW